jgi:hypothetical protein
MAIFVIKIEYETWIIGRMICEGIICLIQDIVPAGD